jgi:hypothetical protein
VPHGEGRDGRSWPESAGDSGGDVEARERLGLGFECAGEKRGASKAERVGPGGLVQPNPMGSPNRWAQWKNGQFTFYFKTEILT